MPRQLIPHGTRWPRPWWHRLDASAFRLTSVTTRQGNSAQARLGGAIWWRWGKFVRGDFFSCFVFFRRGGNWNTPKVKEYISRKLPDFVSKKFRLLQFLEGQGSFFMDEAEISPGIVWLVASSNPVALARGLSPTKWARGQRPPVRGHGEAKPRGAWDPKFQAFDTAGRPETFIGSLVLLMFHKSCQSVEVGCLSHYLQFFFTFQVVQDVFLSTVWMENLGWLSQVALLSYFYNSLHLAWRYFFSQINVFFLKYNPNSDIIGLIKTRAPSVFKAYHWSSTQRLAAQRRLCCGCSLRFGVGLILLAYLASWMQHPPWPLVDVNFWWGVGKVGGMKQLSKYWNEITGEAFFDAGSEVRCLTSHLSRKLMLYWPQGEVYDLFVA